MLGATFHCRNLFGRLINSPLHRLLMRSVSFFRIASLLSDTCVAETLTGCNFRQQNEDGGEGGCGESLKTENSECVCTVIRVNKGDNYVE